MTSKRLANTSCCWALTAGITVAVVLITRLGQFKIHVRRSLHCVHLRSETMWNSATLATKPYPNLNILQYSGHRTGSTYLSQFFNHHADVFYVFEPEKVHDSKREVLMPQILDALYRCDLNSSGPLRSINPTWLRNSVFCRLYPPIGGCMPTLPASSKRCKQSTIRVVKLIMLPKLSLMESFLRRGVRVVHTVRDPRGNVDSLNHIGACKGREKTKNCSRNYCQMILQDLDFIRQLLVNHGDHIRQLYTLIRYEDFAIEAVENMQKLYQFLGVKPDEFTIKWAKENKDKSNIQNTRSQRPSGDLTYSTTRSNPAATSQAWRLRMTLEMVQHIQQEEACRKVMSFLNYRMYENKSSMLDMNYASVTPFDISNLFRNLGHHENNCS